MRQSPGAASLVWPGMQDGVRATLPTGTDGKRGAPPEVLPLHSLRGTAWSADPLGTRDRSDAGPRSPPRADPRRCNHARSATASAGDVSCLTDRFRAGASRVLGSLLAVTGSRSSQDVVQTVPSCSSRS
jgi:hypothetical protein